ncbi:MAG: hypothetical protein AB7F89_24680, partial [Pirellulaceae bacterium]
CLREGKNREIRRVLARIGHKVLQLKRIAIGPLKLGMLPSGATRALTPDEVRQLRQGMGRGPRDAEKSGRPRSNAQREKSSRDKPPRDKPPRDKPPRDKPPRSGVQRSGSLPAKEPRRTERRPPGARSPHIREDLVPARSPPEWQPDEEVAVTSGDMSEVNEVEVTDYEMDRPTGSVLGFDDEPRPSKSARKKRRS